MTRGIPGHKCLGARVGAYARCECGWHSANWFGVGARRNALAEWRSHMQAHGHAGHKSAGTSGTVRTSCECGWSSANWTMGPGARRSAYSEWRYHIERIPAGSASRARTHTRSHSCRA